MPDIDPELWILVHGGIEPESMLEWPLRAQWAWGAAILDMVAERANSIGWPTRWTGQVARQRLEGWRKEVERALTAEWPPDLVALKRAVKLLSEFLWDEIGSEDIVHPVGHYVRLASRVRPSMGWRCYGGPGHVPRSAGPDAGSLPCLGGR